MGEKAHPQEKIIQQMSRLILVLGAHRSGTSLLTASLTSLGVELGDRLHPPKRENARGFHEDLDFLNINESVLQAAGATWHTLGPLDLGKAEPKEAVRLVLADRVSRFPIFGLKDPRLCRLLSFWKPLFASAKLEVSCVVALRHPTEVMLSLNTRNHFSETKGYSLWLTSMVSAMTEMDPGWPRVVVDYDLMLADPEAQIRRISEALDLRYDETKFAAFKERIWDPKLRHEAKHVGVPTEDYDLVNRVYDLLSALATDRRHELDTRGEFLALQHEMRKLKPMLESIDKAERKNRDEQQKAMQEGMFKWPL